MPLYLFLDILILAIPLALSFEKRIRYYQKFPSLARAIVSVGAVFVAWDVLAVHYGDWRFNDRFIVGIKFFGLPIEEILFFIVVPYSCLFIYEVVNYFWAEREVPIAPKAVITVSVLVFIVGWLLAGKVYTCAALSAFSLTLLVVVAVQPGLFRSINYWRFLLISGIPFLIFNGILTAMPVVIYNEAAITGARFFTIPYEDFFYSFVLLTLNLLIYRWAEDRRRR